MTGAMYSAIAGLRTHMAALNVIGNNISNVNTVGYKASRYTFNEALYTMSRAGSNGTAILGGTNPAQIGYGCAVATIDLNMSTSTYTPTGRALDCMIDGDGFFIVGDKGSDLRAADPPDDYGSMLNPFVTASGITTQSGLQGMDLTRVGNFDFKDGFLVDGDGNVVYGFLIVRDGESEASVGEDGSITQENTKVSNILTGIRLPMVEKVRVNIAEEGQPEAYVTQYIFHYPEETAAGLVADQIGGDSLSPDGGDGGGQGDAEGGYGVVYERLSPDTVAIDSTGKITAITADGTTITVGYLAIAKVESPNGVTHTDGHLYQAKEGAGYTRLTTIGSSVSYIPGQRPDDDSFFNELGVDDAGGTTLWTSGLESSNTDLAMEVSNMIVIQRGYQANTRIVSVTDSMLEELVNMKR